MTSILQRSAGVCAAAMFAAAAFPTSTFAQSTEPEAATSTIRIGVAPAEAQLGQGNTAAQGDHAMAIRNSIVLLMSGPAVEIVPLDSRLDVQLQAEAAQKACDYILHARVQVKPQKSGRFGKMLRMAAPAAGMIGMAGGMGGMAAGQAASIAAAAAAQSAQEQAISQLAAFNGQIKSKDDVTVAYRLLPAGVAEPRLQNSLEAKAKTDGEDVLTPLLMKAAEAVLAEVSQKRP